MADRRGISQHRGRSGTDSIPNPKESGTGITDAKATGAFAEGSRFGTYIIGPCIGHGGMARIYRAEHEGLRRQVALKVLTEGVEAGTEGRARFLREARIAAAIKHPNVVNIFDIGVENKIPYLVMELLVGQDLESLLASHGALSEHTIVDIIVPVVAGLVAVHDAGVIHRDLKPGNIYLSKGATDEVEPKLLDFGISKAMVAGEKMRLTSTHGLLMGTPLYMSPEAMLGTDMTPASDQYSLGVLLYECSTGVNPFMADTVAETVRRVTTGQYTPISEQAIRPSRRLQAIIERTMSLDPTQRFKDMRALGQELLQLAGQRTRITWGLTFGQVAAAARASIPPEVTDEAVALAQTRSSRRSRRMSVWPLLGAVCVGVSVVIAFSWSMRREPPAAAAPTPPNIGATTAPPSVAQRPEPVQLAPSANRPRQPEAPRNESPAQAAPEAQRGAPTPAIGGQPQADQPEDAREPTPAAPADEAVEKDTDSPARNRESPRPQRPRPARQRVEPARVEPPRAEAPRVEAPAAEPEQPEAPPDWIVERRRTRVRSSPSNFQTGTNAAPIFD